MKKKVSRHCAWRQWLDRCREWQPEPRHVWAGIMLLLILFWGAVAWLLKILSGQAPFIH